MASLGKENRLQWFQINFILDTYFYSGRVDTNILVNISTLGILCGALFWLWFWSVRVRGRAAFFSEGALGRISL